MLSRVPMTACIGGHPAVLMQNGHIELWMALMLMGWCACWRPSSGSRVPAPIW